jgi:hypothetical protein
MWNDEYQTVLNQVQRLSSEEQFQLLEDLVVMLRQKTTKQPQHSILELAGLGKEVWQGVDVGEYIKRERDAWDTGRP